MTKISEAARVKADELASRPDVSGYRSALALFIQQVSDAAKAVAIDVGHDASEALAPFILPEPVDPVDVKIKAAGYLPVIRSNLAAVGLKIVEDAA